MHWIFVYQDMKTIHYNTFIYLKKWQYYWLKYRILYFICCVVAVQLPSHIWLFVTPCLFVILCDFSTLCDCNKPGLSVPHHLPKFAQVHIPCIDDAIQPSHPLTPSFPSALSLSQHQGVFQWVSCLHQITKILELQLQHQSFQRVFREINSLISLKIDQFDPLAIQGTLRSLLQHHSSKASILQCYTFCMVHLSQPYVTTGKTIALTRWNFVGRVMSLMFNKLLKNYFNK